MIKNVQELIRQKANKGLNTYKNFFNLSDEQTPAAINVLYNNDGSFGKRLGSSTMNTIALESTGGYGMYDFGVLGLGGNDNNTKLLLHYNGTPVVDSSPRAYSVTTYGDLITSALQSKFGGYSGLFAESPELDYMEYSTDALAQAAYVTNGASEATEYAAGSNTLVIHFNGADGATSYTAETGQVATFAGTAALDTAQKKFGTASLLIDANTTDYVTVPDSADWSFGTGNFTVDFWVRFATLGDDLFISQYADDNNYWWFNLTGEKLTYIAKIGGVVKASYVMTSAWVGLAVDTWYHLALVRNGTSILMFINGVSQTLTETTAISTNDVGNVAAALNIASITGIFTCTSDLWFDAVRILKGTAVWTSNFFVEDKLQSYSEATIKTQGSYSLKAIALITDSLNKTLTRTVSPTIDLTNQTQIKFDIRASRTGSNIKIGFHDAGGTTTEHTPNILVADTSQTETVDISGVSNANKDAIDSIIVTILNADAANTFYIDNMYSGNYIIINKSSFLTVPDDNDWNLGLKNFTIDKQIMFNYAATSQAIIGQGSNATNYWLYQYETAGTNTTNGLYFKCYSAGVLIVNVTGLWKPNTATFYHLELVRNSTNNWYMFVDGSSLAAAGTTAGIIPDFASLLKVGVNVVTTNNSYLHAFMDELRISHAARHIVAFTSPTVAYNADIIQERRLLCSSGTGIYYSTDLGKSWATIQTNRSAAINYFGFIKDYIINTNESYDPPQYWAGTAAQYFANISTAAPACKHSASHQGFALLLNESANKTGFYYVDQNSMFNSAWSNFKLPTGRNDELTAGFTIGRSLYVSSKYKLFRLIYIGGNPDWEYVDIRDWGFVPKTVKKINIPGVGESVIGLDWTKKIRIFSGADDDIISDHIAKDNGITPFFLDNLSAVDLNKCWAEDDKKAQVYRLFLCYGGSSTISYAINFNYRSGSWSPEDTRPYQSGILAADTADNQYMLGCNYNGRIVVMDSGNTEGNISINEYHISPFLYQQSPARIFKNQQINMYFSVNSSGTLYYEDRDQFSNVFDLRKTMTLASAISAVQIRHTIDIPENMNVYQFKLSSSANTAEPWQCNLIDLSLSDLGGVAKE